MHSSSKEKPEALFGDRLIFDHETVVEIVEDSRKRNIRRPGYDIKIVCPLAYAERVRRLLEADERIHDLRIRPSETTKGAIFFQAYIELGLDIDCCHPNFEKNKNEVIGFIWQGLSSQLTDIFLGKRLRTQECHVHYLGRDDLN